MLEAIEVGEVTTSNKRELKGIQIVAKGTDIQRQNGSRFLVRSQSNADKQYDVLWQKNGWSCTCPDYSERLRPCKHIFAISYYLKLADITSEVSNSDPTQCPRCSSADNVIKRGVARNQSGSRQRYYCKSCDLRFRDRTGFEGMRHRATIIAAALDLYYRGLSLRQVQEHLEAFQSVKVTHATIYNWIKKYVQLVSQYVETVAVQVHVSEKWHADETLVRVRGRHLVFWGLLDSKTRFLLAMRISNKRLTEDAAWLFRKGLDSAASKPLEIVTDGLSSYSDAIEKECQRESEGSMRGIIHLQGPLVQNNKMERFQRTLKGRTKTMGNLYSKETAKRFSDAFSVYYNFIKPHKALSGRTPAQATGISANKRTWLNLILDAEKHSKQESLGASSSS
ncbi:IS6 family transposase [Candidatus Bathyarchaeota archaeon]|nr:IS6 family transposase [Candidatus Bathyarchaeota archaeon]